MKNLLLTKQLRFWLDENRSKFIPAGDWIETTDVRENGSIRIHWDGSNEGMGFGIVDEEELQIAISPL